MKLKNIEDVTAFLAAVDSCKRDVYLTSQYGDKINLKSKLSQYVAIAALLGKDGEQLELWCDDRDDERKMLDFLTKHPDTL